MKTFLLRMTPQQKKAFQDKAWEEHVSLNSWFLSVAEDSLGRPKAIREPARPKQPAVTDAAPKVVKPKHAAPKPVTLPTTINPFARVKLMTHI